MFRDKPSSDKTRQSDLKISHILPSLFYLHKSGWLPQNVIFLQVRNHMQDWLDPQGVFKELWVRGDYANEQVPPFIQV